MNNMNQAILSVCIPTWNRADYLGLSLKSLLSQYRDIDKNDVEFIVSDNCSSDNTPNVAKYYQEAGLPIIYYRHKENMGAARNFLFCMQRASGKYILLLGDDDILEEGALVFILKLLKDKDYGLVHIHKYPRLSDDYWVYKNLDDYFKRVTFYITFMSSNIFRKDIVEKVENPEHYFSTHLLQLPYYVTSASYCKENLIINNKNILKVALDGENNGGFNLYQVFVESYLSIWMEFVDKGLVSSNTYNFLKKDIYMKFILRHNINVLILRQGIASKNQPYGRKGYYIDDAKQFLKKYYRNEVYFYLSFFVVFWRLTKIIIKRMLGRNK